MTFEEFMVLEHGLLKNPTLGKSWTAYLERKENEYALRYWKERYKEALNKKPIRIINAKKPS
jgi:hypothetical protein